MPDDESRQDGEREISNNTKDTIQVSERNDNVHADAVALARLVPVVRDGLALQEGDEEEDNTADHRAHGRGVNNPGVQLLVNYSEEKPRKGEFGRNHCDAEEQVAEPPLLENR